MLSLLVLHSLCYDYCVKEASTVIADCPTTKTFTTYAEFLKAMNAETLATAQTVALGLYESTAPLVLPTLGAGGSLTFTLAAAGGATDILKFSSIASVSWTAEGIVLNTAFTFVVLTGVAFKGSLSPTYETAVALSYTAVPTNPLSIASATVTSGKFTFTTTATTAPATGLIDFTSASGYQFISEQVTPAVASFFKGVTMAEMYCYVTGEAPAECTGNFYKLSAFDETQIPTDKTVSLYIDIEAVTLTVTFFTGSTATINKGIIYKQVDTIVVDETYTLNGLKIMNNLTPAATINATITATLVVTFTNALTARHPNLEVNLADYEITVTATLPESLPTSDKAKLTARNGQSQFTVTGTNPGNLANLFDYGTQLVRFQKTEGILACTATDTDPCTTAAAFTGKSIIVTNSLFGPLVPTWLAVDYVICLDSFPSPLEVNLTIFDASTPKPIKIVKKPATVIKLMAQSQIQYGVAPDYVKTIVTDDDYLQLSAKDGVDVKFGYVDPGNDKQTVLVGQAVTIQANATIASQNVVELTPSDGPVTITLEPGVKSGVKFAATGNEQIIYRSPTPSDNAESEQLITGQNGQINFENAVELPATSNSSSTPNNLSGGAIAGIVIAVIVVVALAILIPAIIIKLKGRKSDDGARV